MKVLVTGSEGFIGRHMCLLLKRKGHEVLPFDLGNTENELKEAISSCDAIIHLAGINRPLNVDEFYDGNVNFTKKVVDLQRNLNLNALIILSSSIQASLDNDYGKSKKMAEDYVLTNASNCLVYRLSNVFGRGCKPNYNSVCATFCHNIAHDLPIQIRDKDYVVHFNYVEDICNEFLLALEKGIGDKEIHSVYPIHDCSLGRLGELLYYFKEEVESPRHLPALHGEFEFKLFKTFLGYLTEEGHSYNYFEDERGTFVELYKSQKYGQISDNLTFPGITKGGHYHTYKEEIFYTVAGRSLIKERNIETNEMLEYEVDGEHPRFVKMIPNYTHNIKNIGEENSHTLMWISKIYDPNTHDTYKMEVEENGK